MFQVLSIFFKVFKAFWVSFRMSINLLCIVANVQDLLCIVSNLQDLLCIVANLQDLLCIVLNVQGLLCIVPNFQNVLGVVSNVQGLLCIVPNFQSLLCIVPNLETRLGCSNPRSKNSKACVTATAQLVPWAKMATVTDVRFDVVALVEPVGEASWARAENCKNNNKPKRLIPQPSSPLCPGECTLGATPWIPLKVGDEVTHTQSLHSSRAANKSDLTFCRPSLQSKQEREWRQAKGITVLS